MTSLIPIPVLAFAMGFLYDALNVGFMHSSAHGKPVFAAMFSVLVGASALTGIFQVVHHPDSAIYLLLGYFFGTLTAVRLTQKKEPNAQESNG